MWYCQHTIQISYIIVVQFNKQKVTAEIIYLSNKLSAFIFKHETLNQNFKEQEIEK
jgi:hypothetical protein